MAGTAALGGDVVATRGDGRRGRDPLVVLDRLAAFLDERGLGGGPLLAQPIGGGRSNATFLLLRGKTEFVLRRPPRGPLPPSAHDVVREARILQALASTDVPAARVLAVCSNEAVLGATFVVMERVEGVTLSGGIPPELNQPDVHRQISEQLIDVLARIHSVDTRAVGLDSLGRPAGYLERQVRRHLQLWAVHQTRDLPVVEEIGRWLLANLPASGAPTLVHGDYRLGNAMFAAEPPVRLLAVVDWELSTLGDPMVDLGYLCACWAEYGDGSRAWEPDPATRAPGFLTRSEMMARYQAVSGRPVRNLDWYHVLALWRAVVFMEGNYRRAKEGATDDPYLLAFGDRIPVLAEMAYAAMGAA